MQWNKKQRQEIHMQSKLVLPHVIQNETKRIAYDESSKILFGEKWKPTNKAKYERWNQFNIYSSYDY